ncbi:MAG: D-glycero-beta-D-manno-heptose 1-phosphate adenylyltransferase [Candidatus Omnitrophota bacterium]
MKASRKIKHINELCRIVAALRRDKKDIVFTNGCFDILHAGHVNYLEKAKALADVLILGLNSDASVKRLKGKARPIFSQDDRARLLSSLDCVDYVIIFNEDTPLKLIRALRPDILVKGADWKGKGVVGTELVKSYGGKVKLIPLLKGRSTTRIIAKLCR